MVRSATCALAVAAVLAAGLPGTFAQVIEYEANGLKYQTATRSGLTVIVTHLPHHVAGFELVQVSVSNGSQLYWTVKPEQFSWVRQETTLNALPTKNVVDMLLDHGSHGDAVKLVNSYEAALYGIPHMRSTNGYEERRQNAMTYGMSAKLKAAAVASAIALGPVRLAPGQSTDGAVFIPLSRDIRSLNNGHLMFHCENEVFDFTPEP